MKEITRKQKNIMLDPLDSSWAMQALFSEDLSGEEFKQQYGFTYQEACDALEALVEHLKR